MYTMNRFTTLIASFALTGLIACDKAPANSEKSTPVAKADPAATTKAPTAPATKAPAASDLGSSLSAAEGAYTIDSGHTQIVFSVSHMGASNQYGQFTQVKGSFTINAKDVAASEIALEIPASSIFTASKKRDDHLRGPDFFDAKQFPKITFKSTELKATGANTYEVSGDLSMHGVTKKITISLEHGGAAADPEMMGGAFRTGFNGTTTIKRSEFGMNYMPGGLGEDITLLIALEGTRN